VAAATLPAAREASSDRILLILGASKLVVFWLL